MLNKCIMINYRFQKESDIEVDSSWNNKTNQWMQNVVKSGFTNTDEMNEVLAINDIIGLFATHVDAINTIFANTVFRTYDNSISYSGVRFKIQKIKHDSGNLCAPYDNNAVDAEHRNYIMNEEFINGNMQHNDEFSPCSKDNMTRMLDKVYTERFGTINCFKRSVCSKIDYAIQNKVTWVECFVESAGDTVADKEGQCLLGCRSPCNNYRGYCDTFQRCQDVVEKTNNPAESITDTKCWNLKYWWIVLLIAKGLV
ncbi:ADAM10 [Mytilus coruscus]|uniref:ADAM10 n=1 Tax=Mytilus coruscus TaxID=42192 RepID=A0A6J8EDZ5_MYTCO|nr:ADAM10 [Mytilus coruscus]